MLYYYRLAELLISLIFPHPRKQQIPLQTTQFLTTLTLDSYAAFSPTIKATKTAIKIIWLFLKEGKGKVVPHSTCLAARRNSNCSQLLWVLFYVQAPPTPCDKNWEKRNWCSQLTALEIGTWCLFPFYTRATFLPGALQRPETKLHPHPVTSPCSGTKMCKMGCWQATAPYLPLIGWLTKAATLHLCCLPTILPGTSVICPLVLLQQKTESFVSGLCKTSGRELAGV